MKKAKAGGPFKEKNRSLFISPEVLAELSRPVYPNRELALKMTIDAKLIAVDATVLGLAKILVTEKVMPSPAGSGDAIHVAAATVHEMEYILSWNVRHLANVNKIKHLRAVCLRAGLLPPNIITPDALWPENPTGEQ